MLFCHSKVLPVLEVPLKALVLQGTTSYGAITAANPPERCAGQVGNGRSLWKDSRGAESLSIAPMQNPLAQKLES